MVSYLQKNRWRDSTVRALNSRSRCVHCATFPLVFRDHLCSKSTVIRSIDLVVTLIEIQFSST